MVTMYQRHMLRLQNLASELKSVCKPKWLGKVEHSHVVDYHREVDKGNLTALLDYSFRVELYSGFYNTKQLLRA